MVGSENGTTTVAMTIDTQMELYSVVLSSTTLCLALFFGSGGNITILLSLCFSGLMSRLRYIFLSVLLIVCTLYDLLWCPLEIYRLIHHHHSPHDVGSDVKFAGQCMFISLFTGLFCSLLTISFHSICVLMNKLVQKFANIIIMACGIIGIILLLVNTIGYSIVSAKYETSDLLSYLILNDHSYIYRVTCYSVCIACSVIFTITMVAMLIYQQNVQTTNKGCEDSDYSEPPTPERLNINIPSLLIKGADEDNPSDNENEDNEKITKSIHDSTKHLGPQDVASLKDDNTSTLGELPSPSRTKNNHLSVNMAAILGRRRHTIGQIGSTGLDVMEKAKQYNYVRKFSVDIQALQAQLENPKIHGGNFPFRSDTELQKSAQNDRKEFLLRRPQTPNLDTRTWDKTDMSFSESKEDISKSNEECCRTSIHSQKSIKSNKSSRSNKSSKSNKSSDTRRNSSHETVSPPIITLSETTAEETHILDFQEDKGPTYVKLCCLLIITFICCLLPMYITETVRHRLSSAAYINILTCTMALSVVQTIIYPHVLFCMDNFIHNAVHKFFGKFHSQVMLVCYERQPIPTDNIDITVTQV